MNAKAQGAKKRRVPQRKKPGRLNRIRLGILALLVAAVTFHMIAWYVLEWRTIGKFSFSGYDSLLVGHINMAAIFCVALTAAVAFTGRLFCGYGCKLSAFQDFTEAVYQRIGFRPTLLHTRARVVRVFIFVPYLLPVLYMWRDRGLSTSYYNLGAVELWTSDLPQTVLGSVFYFVSITFVLTAVFGRRAFCRLICPFALLFKSFERLPWIPRIQQVGRCIDCGVCDRSCPMGVPVANQILRQGQVTDGECIRCMVCADVCPVKGLRYQRERGGRPIQQPELEPAFQESALPIGADVVLATLAVICGGWAATHFTGFHVFLGASWGLIGGALGWRAWTALRGKESPWKSERV